MNKHKSAIKRCSAFVMAVLLGITAFPQFTIKAQDNDLTFVLEEGVKEAILYEVVRDEEENIVELKEVDSAEENKYSININKEYQFTVEVEDDEEKVLACRKFEITQKEEEESLFESAVISGATLSGQVITILCGKINGTYSISGGDERATVTVRDVTEENAIVTSEENKYPISFLHEYKVSISVSKALKLDNIEAQGFAKVSDINGNDVYEKVFKYQDDVKDTITISERKYTLSQVSSEHGSVYTEKSVDASKKLTGTVVNYGASKDLYIIPESSYQIKDVKINNISIRESVEIDVETNIGVIRLVDIQEDKRIEVIYQEKRKVSATDLSDAGIEIIQAGESTALLSVNTSEVKGNYQYYYIPSSWSGYIIKRDKNFRYNLNICFWGAAPEYIFDSSRHLKNIVDANEKIAFSPEIIILKEGAKPTIEFTDGKTEYYVSDQSPAVTFTGTVGDTGETVLGLEGNFASGISHFSCSESEVYSPDTATLIRNVAGNFTYSLSENPTCDTTYYFFAVDKCGNEKKVQKKVIIDNEAPRVKKVSVKDGFYILSGEQGFTSKEFVDVEVNVTDEKSGVKSVDLYRDGVKVASKSNITFDIVTFTNIPIDKEGNNMFTAVATDYVSNVSTAVEETAPATLLFDNQKAGITIETDLYSAEDIYYLNAERLDTIKVLVEQKDNTGRALSGIQSVQVYLNGSSEEETVDADGKSFAIIAGTVTTHVEHNICWVIKIKRAIPLRLLQQPIPVSHPHRNM